MDAIKDTTPNAMFMNGPKAGQIIYISDPEQEVVVGTMINLCKHRPEDANPMLMIKYKIYSSGSYPLYHLITDDKTIANAYYCMECKAEAEVKYKLEEIKDLLDEALEEDEDDSRD